MPKPVETSVKEGINRKDAIAGTQKRLTGRTAVHKQKGWKQTIDNRNIRERQQQERNNRWKQ
jgi:hypothetical protein